MSFFFIDDAPSLLLTQKGYGYAQSVGGTGNVTLGYGTVSSGSAPVAGDLVVWTVYAYDNAAQAINDLTGSGWTQDRRYIAGSLCSSVLTKVVVAGDVSSPPTGVTAPTAGSVAAWVAYTITGSVSALTVNNHDSEFSSASAPASDIQNSTTIPGESYSITVACGGGSDDNIGLNWSGATPDFSFQRTNIDSGIDVKFDGVLVLGGANVTISKDDDGTLNSLFSAYVAVS